MGKHKRKDDSSSDDSRSPSSSPERKRSKKDKKEKHKKKHKKEHKDKDKDKLLKEAKKFLKEKLKGGDPGVAAALGAGSSKERHGHKGKGRGGGEAEEPPVALADVVPISTDDYFNRNAEFSVWLRDARRIYFNELSSEEAHALFPEFVAAWNAGKLPAKFYSGTAAKATQRTSYAWSFKGGAARADQGALGMAGALADDVNLKEEERAAAREARQRQQQEEREWLDQVAPKATGREALLEKKLARREAAKAREESPEQLRVTGGGDIMGGDDSFEAARAREARRQDWRSKHQVAKAEAVQAKLAQAQAAEDAKLDHFRALLARGPLQIAKRQ